MARRENQMKVEAAGLLVVCAILSLGRIGDLHADAVEEKGQRFLERLNKIDPQGKSPGQVLEEISDQSGEEIATWIPDSASFAGRPPKTERSSEEPAAAKNVFVIDAPSIGRYRLDRCFYFADYCDFYPAYAFCRMGGFAAVHSWEVLREVGPKRDTWILGEGRACTPATCGSFKYIACQD